MRKPNGYWNVYEHCYEEAKNCKSRREFWKFYRSAYKAALRHKWLDDYTWFVDGRTKLFVDKIDSVYKYVFSDGAIYVGRTLMNRQNDRHNEHKTDTVGKYAKEHNIEIPQMIIIEDNLTVTEGLEREDYWVNWYKEKGYNVINKAKTGIGCGALGSISHGKWNKETVFEEAKKYKTRSEFQTGCNRAYTVARKNGWLSEMGFVENIKTKGYWDVFENVEREAKKYKTRSEFQTGCRGAYLKALKNKWLDDYTWFAELIKPKGYWNKENVFKEALKYTTRSDFYKGCRSAYDAAKKHGWLDILFPAKKVA